jgi:hypothetical protein
MNRKIGLIKKLLEYASSASCMIYGSITGEDWDGPMQDKGRAVSQVHLHPLVSLS